MNYRHSFFNQMNNSYRFIDQRNNRHRVFVSYYHRENQCYRNQFEGLFSDIHDIMISEEIGDIDPNLNTETIRQKIRDEYLQDSTVTVVLVGVHTWQRKFVDWEIGSYRVQLLPTYTKLMGYTKHMKNTKHARHFSIEDFQRYHSREHAVAWIWLLAEPSELHRWLHY